MQQSLFKFFVFGALLVLILIACQPQAKAQQQTPILPLSTAAIATSPSAISIAETENYAGFIEQMLIIFPGADSSLLSPFVFEVQFVPPSDGPVRIELVSENGSLLARKIVVVETLSEAELAQLKTTIYFKLDRSAIDAHLIVSQEDSYGRLMALDSVPIILLSTGHQILLPNESATHITIASSEEHDQQQPGKLIVSGVSATPPGRPLNIELITRTGRVLAFGEVYPTFDVSDSGSFSITLNYELDQAEWVLIAVAERANGVIIHYASVEVLLQPTK